MIYIYNIDRNVSKIFIIIMVLKLIFTFMNIVNIAVNSWKFLNCRIATFVVRPWRIFCVMAFDAHLKQQTKKKSSMHESNILLF